MSEWAMKRFWKVASFEPMEAGYEVRLDGRAVKTPAKRPLILPTETMAYQVAVEWQAQDDVVDPTAMPWTRSANAAIDKVAMQRQEVMDHLASYAETDLLCYRAEGPEALIEWQQRAWDPLIDWAAETYGARLALAKGVMPVAQSPANLARLAATMRGMSIFQLTGFYDLVTLTGSFLLALAATEGRETPEDLWAHSRVDELWQIEQWGEDEEAMEHAELKKSAFFHAISFYKAA